MRGRVDPKQIVARGYDAIALRYAEWAGTIDSPTMAWLRELLDLLPPASDVLELGCGRGVPATRELAKHHRVVGVDISSAQVSLARHHVPEATFVLADAMELELPPVSFDAVVSLYLFGHIPLDEHAALLDRIAGWLRPGGLFLTTMSAGPGQHEEVEADWLGAPMYFAGMSEEDNRGALREAGFELIRAEVVPQDEPGHGTARFLWVLAEKPE